MDKRKGYDLLLIIDKCRRQKLCKRAQKISAAAPLRVMASRYNLIIRTRAYVRKKFLSTPFFPLGLKLNVPTIFSSPFSQLLCSRMIWWIIPVCSFVIPKQVHICVHTNFLSPSCFVSPPYYVSSTNCLFISAFNVKQGSTSVSLLGTICLYLKVLTRPRYKFLAFRRLKYLFEKSDIPSPFQNQMVVPKLLP